MATVHIRSAGSEAVRVDRATRWGNPFVVGKDGTRDEVIERHRLWIWREVKAGRITLEDLASLHGKDLACWCAPQACHADTLARAAAWARKELS